MNKAVQKAVAVALSKLLFGDDPDDEYVGTADDWFRCALDIAGVH